MTQPSLFNPPPPMPGQRCATCGAIAAAPAPLTSVPPSHTGGPATEKLAALRAWPRAESSRARVLHAIARAGSNGRTFDELRVELTMYSAQKRLHDLKRGGWVEASGIRRPTGTGAEADVYILSPQARAEFQVRYPYDELPAAERS